MMILSNIGVFFLLFLYFFEYLCEKYCHSGNDHKENNLPNSWEKYGCNTKYTGEEIDDKSYLRLREPEFHESVMKMMRLISFHRILSLENTSRDHIDEVDEVESKDRHGSCNFPPCNNCKSCNEKCKHDSSRVTHDEFSRDIGTCEEECYRYDNRKNREEKSTIFLAINTCISDIELECEGSKDNKANERKSTSEPRNSI